jgi:hypothetical protein
MFRPIRMDHTNCLQVAIKTLQFREADTAPVDIGDTQPARTMPRGRHRACSVLSVSVEAADIERDARLL